MVVSSLGGGRCRAGLGPAGAVRGPPGLVPRALGWSLGPCPSLSLSLLFGPFGPGSRPPPPPRRPWPPVAPRPRLGSSRLPSAPPLPGALGYHRALRHSRISRSMWTSLDVWLVPVYIVFHSIAAVTLPGTT